MLYFPLFVFSQLLCLPYPSVLLLLLIPLSTTDTHGWQLAILSLTPQVWMCSQSSPPTLRIPTRRWTTVSAANCFHSFRFVKKIVKWPEVLRAHVLQQVWKARCPWCILNPLNPHTFVFHRYLFKYIIQYITQIFNLLSFTATMQSLKDFKCVYILFS